MTPELKTSKPLHKDKIPVCVEYFVNTEELVSPKATPWRPSVWQFDFTLTGSQPQSGLCIYTPSAVYLQYIWCDGHSDQPTELFPLGDAVREAATGGWLCGVGFRAGGLCRRSASFTTRHPLSHHPVLSSQWTTWRSPPWTRPQPRSSTSSMAMSVGPRAPGRLASSRTWPTPMAVWPWGSSYLTPNMRSSKWSRMPVAAICCSMARGPATGPARTGLRREPPPIRCP